MVTRSFATADLQSVAPLWRNLESQLGGAVPVAASWDWVQTWVSNYGDIVPSSFVVAEDGNTGIPLGIALVASNRIKRSRFFTVKTRHLGTAGEPEADSACVEYNALLTAPGQQVPFAQALVGVLRSRQDWDELRVDGFAPDDIQPFLDAALGAGLPFEVGRRASPMTDLRDAGKAGAVLARLKSGTQSKIRRSLRGFGAVDEQWAESEADALDILDELITLHQQRWSEAGEPGSFASRRFTSFHRELVKRLLPKKAVVLFRGRAGGKTIGCLYSFIDRGRVLFYQSGFASYEDSKLKPGLVLHSLCMQRCAERGYTEYDFLAGEGRYKSELATGEGQLIWGVHKRPRLLLSLESALRSLRARVESPPA
jgi:CelD/BcsL family acetyltransferase involved in cellulose biosynthesis